MSVGGDMKLNRICGLVFLVCLSTARLSGATPWFDAGIAGYEDWPSDGSDKVVAGEGTWTGTSGGKLLGEPDSRRLSVESEEPLSFDIERPQALAESVTAFELVVRFSLTDELLDVGDDLKGALTVSEDGGKMKYFGLVASPAGTDNTWVPLGGVEPDLDRDVRLRIEMRTFGQICLIRYQIDGSSLTRDGVDWFPIAVSEAKMEAVACVGEGALSSLSGEIEAVTGHVAMTVPALQGLDLVSVSVGGAPVEMREDGTFAIPAGALVTVVFEPQGGRVVASGTMTFRAGAEDFSLPEEGRPVAVEASRVLSISEIAASNDEASGIVTAHGGVGLDWVEIRNTADFDIDLTDWYLHDTPTDKKSKWKRIAVSSGRFVVPSGGHAVVWCDKTYSDWAENEGHSSIGLSTSGEPLFLADPHGVKVCEIENFGRQLKNVTVGRGHLTRTLLPANAAARYRLGTDGEWIDVQGAVGMSAAATGFQTVTYRINRTVNTMDVAERCLADPTSWLSVPTTNEFETLNFKDGTGVDFDGFVDFPGVEPGEDNYVVVATGTLVVPRTGLWSFAVGSDDGFAAKISRLGDSWTWENRGGRGYAQSVATFNLEAGAYDMEVVYFENAGGAAFDFSCAEGEKVFDKTVFALVGSSASGIVHAGAMGAQFAVDLSEAMRGVTDTVQWKSSFACPSAPAEGDAFRLRIRYADGFTAALNGEVFASVPATAPRSTIASLSYSYFDIPTALVREGLNELLVTGVNDSVADTEFLLSPEVLWNVAEEQLVYFTEPTPGAANTAGGRTGFTPAVTFGEPHGYKTEPFDLALACPENPSATIYYTLDGSVPVIGAETTHRYDGPFEISRTTVVRAAVPDADSILQVEASATYLFLADILTQDATPPVGFPESLAVNNQKMVYGLSSALVQGDEETRTRLTNGFTNAIATVSLVLDPKDLFDKTKGIYVNASGNGRGWERPTMVEQIDPVNGPDNEFSVPAGIRIRGAVSRGSEFPKHSFRLFFRSDYGMSKLSFPLFGSEGPDTFEKIDLRTEQNFSWATGGDRETFIHEVFSRDSQRDLGQPYNRSRYYNLFINGVYWGLYQTEERVCQDSAETQNGGTAENYDVVRTSQPGYNTGVVEGEGESWENLWRITTQEGYGDAHPENYNRVRGLNPDGTRNPDYPVYLNVTNLMAFMLTSQYTADSDAPANGGGMANNLAAYRNRVDGEGRADGFLWNRHDAERSLSYGDSYWSGKDTFLYGTRGANHSLALGNFNPAELHYELCANAEYRQAFADFVYRQLLREGGAMTVTNALQRFRTRMDELDDAIVCEAARWGQVPNRQMTHDDWLRSCQPCLEFIERRTPFLISAYRELGWYPSVDAPSAVGPEGQRLLGGETVDHGGRVTLTGDDGVTVYYTTDGSDPRLEGGDVAETAVAYASAFEVPIAGMTLRMRARTAEGEWSALEELSLAGTQPPDYATPEEAVRVAAILSSTADGSGDGAEFVLLTNVTDRVVSLAGLRLVAWNSAKKSEASPSLTIDLPAVEIPAGGSFLVDKATYFGSGKLTNSGVGLKLYTAEGVCVQEIGVDANWWEGACDETGDWFVALDFGPLVTSQDQWRSSRPVLPVPTIGAIRVGMESVQIEVSVSPGFYYTLQRSTSLASGFESVERKQAPEGASVLPFEVRKGADRESFFKVIVTDRD